MTASEVESALDEMLAVLHRFVAFHDEHQAHTLVLFAAATHAAPELETVPYLEITGPTPGCGKTTCGTITGQFMRGRPAPMSKATPAGLRRQLTRVEDGSIIFDEIDRVDPKADYGLELFSTINAGYNRSSSTQLRADMKSKDGTIEETSFGFKILIGIDNGKLPDTTRSRCIPIVMRRALPGETAEQWEPTRPQWTFLTDVADRFQKVLGTIEWSWIPDNLEIDNVISLDTPEILSFSNRSRQLWRPLLAVARFAGPTWLTRALAAAKELGGDNDVAVPVILVDIAHVLSASLFQPSTFETSDGAAIPSADLRRALVTMEDSRWMADDRRRRSELSGRRLGVLLKPYRIVPKQRAVLGDGKSNHRSYLVSELADASVRYGASAPHIATEPGRAGRTQTPQGFPVIRDLVEAPPLYQVENSMNPSDTKGSTTSTASNPQVKGNEAKTGTLNDLPDPW